MDMVEKYYHLLLALESDPLISMKDLATKLNITFPTLKKRYQFLLDEKIILNSSCSINLEALGLTKILVYFEVENYSQLTTLEKIGELHPYTRYHGRCIGNKFGLYFEFDIPDEDQCFELILELFNTIIERRIASSVKVYSSLGYRHEIFPDFTKFDPDNRKWDFDWESWFNKLPQQDNIINYELSKKIDPINLTKIRLDILRKFTINASFKQADLIRDSTLHL
ncbi:MAG: Lrp/AsnC family transcriptional regulator, partial [Candidatus Heimdallarchaeota archaeon]|nr:Lrp/AsnC family transcriptional regulator [Candidatus Heimdallarchaeota archaeon]